MNLHVEVEMPSDIKLDVFRVWFAKYGIVILPGGKHLKMVKMDSVPKEHFPLPTVRGRYVKHVYLQKARKAFHLTPEDGVSDEDFFG